jgi:anti-anti-sigma regulatory factor
MDDLRPSEATIEVRRPRPDAAVVVVSGEHDLTSAAQLNETLTTALTDCTHLIVDLSFAAFID